MPKQILTAKFCLKTNDAENAILLETMQTYLAACNYVSDYVYTSKCLSSVEIHKQVYRAVRTTFSLPSQMACSVICTVAAAYKTMRSHKQPWTKVRFRHAFYDLVWNRDYILTGDTFSIGTLQGRLKLQFYKKGQIQYFDGNNRFGSAKVICRKGKFYLVVSVERDVPDPLLITNVVGIDRGINFLVATYNSAGKNTFVSGRNIKNRRGTYKQVRKELQQVGTKSAKRRLKLIGKRENRWMSDINHQVSKALVESNPPGTLFVLEDLSGVRNVTEKIRKRDRYISVSWAFHDLGEKLKYKALRVSLQ